MCDARYEWHQVGAPGWKCGQHRCTERGHGDQVHSAQPLRYERMLKSLNEEDSKNIQDQVNSDLEVASVLFKGTN